MYNAGSFRQEDAPRVKDSLTQFDKYKSKLPEDKRDISKYSRISEIDTAVAPHIGTAATNAERKEQVKANAHMPGKHELKYEDDKIAVYHLKDEATSKELYASKTAKKPGVYPTEWCTAWTDKRDCKFGDYQSKGNMFPIHYKPTGEVFQMHPREISSWTRMMRQSLIRTSRRSRIRCIRQLHTLQKSWISNLVLSY
jgi:hypothetical protein